MASVSGTLTFFPKLISLRAIRKSSIIRKIKTGMDRLPWRHIVVSYHRLNRISPLRNIRVAEQGEWPSLPRPMTIRAKFLYDRYDRVGGRHGGWRVAKFGLRFWCSEQILHEEGEKQKRYFLHKFHKFHDRR